MLHLLLITLGVISILGLDIYIMKKDGALICLYNINVIKFIINMIKFNTQIN